MNRIWKLTTKMCVDILRTLYLSVWSSKEQKSLKRLFTTSVGKINANIAKCMNITVIILANNPLESDT